MKTQRLSYHIKLCMDMRERELKIEDRRRARRGSKGGKQRNNQEYSCRHSLEGDLSVYGQHVHQLEILVA